MSKPVLCEWCGKDGRRKNGQIAPEGWLFAEVAINSQQWRLATAGSRQ